MTPAIQALVDEQLVADLATGTLSVDEPPTYELDAPVFQDEEYPDYDSVSTRVISGPLGGTKFPGTRFYNWHGAKKHAESKYRVRKFWTVPGRWFARVDREAASGGGLPPNPDPPRRG